MSCGLSVITTNTCPFNELIGIPELLIPVSHYTNCQLTDKFIENVGYIYTCNGTTFLSKKYSFSTN